MKFAATRRGFLSLLGAAPAAPLAAKSIIDEHLAGMTGIEFGAVGGRTPYSNHCEPPGAVISNGRSEELAKEFFNVFGLPEHIEEDFRRDSQNVTYFDPDIAAKRSWSHSVKMLTQRQRNFGKLKDGMRHRIAKDRKTKAFRELTGYDWPYWY